MATMHVAHDGDPSVERTTAYKEQIRITFDEIEAVHTDARATVKEISDTDALAAGLERSHQRTLNEREAHDGRGSRIPFLVGLAGIILSAFGVAFLNFLAAETIGLGQLGTWTLTGIFTVVEVGGAALIGGWIRDGGSRGPKFIAMVAILSVVIIAVAMLRYFMVASSAAMAAYGPGPLLSAFATLAGAAGLLLLIGALEAAIDLRSFRLQVRASAQARELRRLARRRERLVERLDGQRSVIDAAVRRATNRVMGAGETPRSASATRVRVHLIDDLGIGDLMEEAA